MVENVIQSKRIKKHYGRKCNSKRKWTKKQ